MNEYPNMNSFRDAVIDYLKAEKAYCEEDIARNRSLTDPEKVEAGLLIETATISRHELDEYQLILSENNTKLRPGDKITLIPNEVKKKFEATVIENGESCMIVQTLSELPEECTYRIEINECALLDSLIKLAEKIEEGGPGSFWMSMMAGLEMPDKVGLGRIDPSTVRTIPENLNKEQRELCELMLNRPSVYCLQGPPGTGKTDVLATIANTFSSKGKEVLVISNTHQAVNNALNKIHKINPQLPVVKIGEELKAQGLMQGIINEKSYTDYLHQKKQTKSKSKMISHDIVGMTFQAAVINLGLRKSGFKPSVVLVDEAGQMPMVEGALIGAFGSGSVLFIGDDRQMPPIYHEKLKHHSFSTSIFSFFCQKYPGFKSALTTTYRMNWPITEFCSRNFYEPFGISLHPSKFSAYRFMENDCKNPDERIRQIMLQETPLMKADVSKQNTWEDENDEEATFIANLVLDAMCNHIEVSEMAVITPYRRQVKAIRQKIREKLGEDIAIALPLIDTVERLQGQDVDMIIISLCTTNPDYYKKNIGFIMDMNRLNVMISRAKKKVVIFGKYICGDNHSIFDEWKQVMTYEEMEEKAENLRHEIEEKKATGEKYIEQICHQVIDRLNAKSPALIDPSCKYPETYSFVDIMSCEIQNNYYEDIHPKLRDVIDDLIEKEFERLQPKEQQIFEEASVGNDRITCDMNSLYEEIFRKLNAMLNEHWSNDLQD